MAGLHLALYAAAAHLVGGVAVQTVEWRQIGDTAGFPGVHRALDTIVAARPGARAAQFCVVLQDRGDGDPILFALWPAAHQLYRWRATRDAQLGDETLLLHEPLDLRRDIVRTPADRLSTYKVTAAWVQDVRSQCRAHGEQVRISRRRP